MAIEKAKTLNDINVEDIKNKIESYEKAIEHVKKEQEVRKKIYDVQMASEGRVLNPNFDFEEKDEYKELLKEQWTLSYNKTKMGIEAETEQIKYKIDELKKELLLKGDKK